MDITAIGAVAAGLKPTVDLAESLLKLIGGGKGRDEAIKLYGQIVSAHQSALAAQSAQVALIEEKRALEAKLAEFEEWDRTKQRYELQPVGHGAFVYVVKEGERRAEPPHSICPNCYEQRRRSILQSSGINRHTGEERLSCLSCEKVIVVPHGAQRGGAPSYSTF
jgi:hypothetical protein